MRSVAALCLLSLTSCASIFHGRYQKVPVTSDPAGAAVSVDCGKGASASGVTPAVVTLRRGAEACRLTLRKEGYTERVVTFERTFSRTSLWNIGVGVAAGTAAGAAAATGSLLCDYNCNDNSSNTASLVWLGIGTAGAMWIDHATGAMYRHEPSRVEIRLEPNR